MTLIPRPAMLALRQAALKPGRSSATKASTSSIGRSAAANRCPTARYAFVETHLGHPHHQLGQLLPVGRLQAGREVESNRPPHLTATSVSRTAILELVEDRAEGPVEIRL